MKLSVNNISRSFGGVQALLDVSFDVELGTIHGLIGPNGAGKTTLINILSGVLPPTMGQVLYQGHALHHLPAHQVAALGVARTFQNIRLFPTMTCLENVQAGQHLTAQRPLLPRLLRLPSAGREDRRARGAGARQSRPGGSGGQGLLSVPEPVLRRTASAGDRARLVAQPQPAAAG